MASYTELAELLTDEVLLGRVSTATWLAAVNIQEDETPPTNQAKRLRWANAVFREPFVHSRKMLIALLADNKDLTVTQIQNATDNAIQTRVDSKVDGFVEHTF